MTITLTGIDEKTNWKTLEFLYDQQPFELGILYSGTPEGRNRYPSFGYISDFVDEFGSTCAVHICGSIARAELLSGQLDDMLKQVWRVQVNGHVPFQQLIQICNRLPGQMIITQYNPGRDGALLHNTPWNHSTLIDSSGGRGIKPEAWAAPTTDACIGFAGGLGPDSIDRELPEILRVVDTGWWIDMEGKLRDESDWFCVARAATVLMKYKRIVEHHN